MHYQPLVHDHELRLITLLPSQDSTAPIQCQVDHFAVDSSQYSDEYRQQLKDDSAASPGEQARTEWIEWSQNKGHDVLGRAWVDARLHTEDATKHLPQPRYEWGDYMALSYTWGDPNRLREITVNGVPMNVTENLESALRTLRDTQYIRDGWKLWIDAICINQKDAVERGTQVKRMREIYTKAWSPLVWLGPASDDSDNAIELIKTVSSTYSMGDALGALLAELKKDPERFGRGRWKALHQFLVRPYWRRTWILQEASLGRDDMPVLCGIQTLAWADIYRTFWLVNKSDELINRYMTDEVEEAGLKLDVDIWKSLFVTGEISKFQAEPGKPEVVTLYRVLSLSRSVLATDPRDKIYGLLALMSPSLTSRISPSYEAEVTDVYVDFVKSTVEATKSLEVLRHTTPYGEGFPSWVPDWTADHKFSSLTLSNTLHTTSGTTEADVQYLGQHRLGARGFIVDRLDGLGCTWNGGWPADTVVQSSVTTKNPYRNDAGIRDAIWRTMVADRDVYVEPLQENYSALLALVAIADGEKDIPKDDPLKDVARQATLDWGAKFLRGNGELLVCGKPFREQLPKRLAEIPGKINATVLKDALVARDRINVRRRLITTQRGLLGTALEVVEQGDIVAVLFGCSMPMILRPVVRGDDATAYKVLGECYVHGLMEGQGIQWLEAGECVAETLVLV